MDMPVAQEAKLIEALGPMLRRARLRTKILGYDHNWSEHENDIAATPPGEDPETEYPTKLLESRAGRWLAGTAFHCYAGDPSRQTELQHAFPDKGIWFTECSGSHGATDPPAQVFSDTLKWHTRNVVLGVTRNWGKTVVNWNLALDPAGGPHNGGCDTCSGVVTVGPGQTVTKNAEYYTLGHLARFVRPGAVRIASTSFGTTGWNGQIMDAAFRNRDGSTALVVHNENDDPRSFAVTQGGSTFEYTLPGGALATFTWPASRALQDGRTLIAATAAGEAAKRGRRRRHHALEHGRGAGAGPVARGRPRSPAARAPRGARHRRRRRRLPARLFAARPASTARTGVRRPPAPATASSPPSTSRRPQPASCASSRPRPRRNGGRSPTCGSTAEEEVHDQARADPAPDRGGARLVRGARLGCPSRVQGRAASR